MNEHRFFTIMFPTRGTTTKPGGRAIAITGTPTIDHIDLATYFPDNWNDGQYYTIKSTVDFYLQTSSGATDTIATTIPGSPITQECVLFGADIEYSGLVFKGDQYMHILGTGAGTLYIWKSSSSHI